jgi:serine/threonine protein kinase/serine phosphatase RsbU (regulator of sigma subunit)
MQSQNKLVAGFTFDGILGQGATSTVYRAHRNSKTYALKLFNQQGDFSDHQNRLRFLREAAVIAQLNHPGLVKVVEVDESNGRPFLVMEIVEGESLQARISKAAFDAKAWVDLAKTLAQILDHFHSHGVVHRDLKPENILFSAKGEVKVIDFGFAKGAESNSQSNASEEFHGTVLYAAPEQSNLLKRPIDNRSDLYALGGILYFCATGRAAFAAPSVADLLQMHLTVKPTPPIAIRKDLDPVISAVILKLLQKDPDDRYQSAKGLLADLDSLATIRDRGEPFALGTRDSAQRLIEPLFVGRNEERLAIEAAGKQALKSHGGILIVEGEGGSGKSRLLREAFTSASGANFVTLSAKAKQGEDTPFGPLREALDDFLERAQRNQNSSLLEGVRQAAGDLGGIVGRLAPQLQKLLANAPEIPQLEGSAEQDRFYQKTAEFLLALPKYLGPVLLLIDDVQWLDHATIELFKRMSLQINSTPLLLACTSRNDPQSHAALEAFVATVGQCQPKRILLSALPPVAVGELIASRLGGKPLDPETVQKLTHKAKGNPLAVGEYLRALLERGWIRPSEQEWVVFGTDAQDLNLPEDVIDLLINRIAALESQSKDLLTSAALLGFQFDPEILTSATRETNERVQRALTDAIHVGMIERTERGYEFVHDRICEALIRDLTPEVRRTLHQKIAETLDQPKYASAKRTFEIARHYFLGHTERNSAKICATSLAAGQLALDNFANEEAFEYLQRALHAAQLSSATNEQVAHIHEALGVACSATARQSTAVQHFESALTTLTSPMDRARLHYLMGLACGFEGSFERSRQELVTALSDLGIHYPRTALGSIFSLLRHLMAAEIRMRVPALRRQVSSAERARRLLISRIHSAMTVVGYRTSDEDMIMQTMLREIHNTQFLGVTAEAAKAYSFYGLFFGLVGLKRTMEKHCQRAIAMATQLGDQEAITYCQLYYGLSIEFAGDVLRGRKFLMDVYDKVVRYGASWEKSTLVGHRMHMIMAGMARENIAWLEKTMPVLKQANDVSMFHSVYMGKYTSFQILGRSIDAAQALSDQKALPNLSTSSKLAATTYYAFLLHGLLIKEDFGPEMENSLVELERISINIYHARYRFALMGIAQLELYRRAKDEVRRQNLAASIRTNIRKSGFPTALTPLHLCLHYVLKGGWQVMTASPKKALRSLRRAEELADQSDNFWALWLIARERARLAEQAGDDLQRERQARKALEMAKKHGWTPQALQIQRDFQIVDSDFANTTMENKSTAYHTTRQLTTDRKSEALLHISMASMSTLDPRAQSSAILDALILAAGAERAFLFVVEESNSLKLRSGRDGTKNDIVELTGYSNTVVQMVDTERRPLVVSGTDEGEALGSQSIVAHNLRSIMAVPILFRDKYLGVVYLDSTVAKGIFAKEDLEFVTLLANHIGIALEGIRSTNVEIEMRAFKKDLEVTNAVQSLMLPKQGSINLDRLSLASFYKSASQSGGDWWHCDHHGQRFSVFVGDVTGHGAGPAMISAALSGSFYTFKAMRQAQQSTPHFFELINNNLLELAGDRYCVSMSGVDIDLETGKCDLWSAGAPPIVWLSKSKPPEFVFAQGNLLGFGDFLLGQQSFTLEPGDRLVMFTDGLYEIQTLNKRELSFKALEGMLVQTWNEPPEQATLSLTNKIKELRSPESPEDDITLVMVDFK